MTRVTFFAGSCFCLAAALPLLQAQQTPAPAPAPVVQTTGSGSQQQPPATDVPQLPANTVPVPVVTDPQTALPVLPEDQREQEIDKFDPMKRNVNPVPQPEATPLTDRKQPQDETADPDAKSKDAADSTDATKTAKKTKKDSDSTTADDSADDDTATADNADTNGAEYSGPAVLSRSYTLARPMVPRQIKWAANVGFSYSFDDGQTPTLANGETTFLPTTTSGRSLYWNFSGRHIWKRDQLGVSYGASYSQFGISTLGGINNALSLDYSHVVSRRIIVHFVESGSQFSENYSLENPNPTPATTIANINLAASPNIGLINSKTRSSSSTASASYRQSSRLSYSISSSYFITGVTGGVGVYGYQFGGDVNYRWTRRATVGTYYSYSENLYTHNISSADTNSAGMIFSYALDATTQLRTRFGAARIESLGYETVALPAELAALLGQGSTIINAYALQWTSDVSVELVRDLRRTRKATLAYAHGESPGNGVLLTSVQQTFSAGYGMALFRKRLPLNVNGSYSTLHSVAQGDIGYFKSESVSLSTSRKVGRGATSNLSIAYRRYSVSDTPLQAHDLSISLSIGWSVPQRWMRF